MAHGDVESALATLGFTGTFEDVERKTLARYLWDLRDSGDDRFRIVNIPGHYVAIGGRGEEACDSFSKQPVPPEKIKHRRAHVLYELIINEGVKT
jgi:hypothetical protein